LCYDIEPRVHSARARAFSEHGHSHALNDIIFNRYIPKAGDYRVKTRRGGNHVDMIISWDTIKNSGILIGGNVNDRITIRECSIQSFIADGTTHIIDVKGSYNYRLKKNNFSIWLQRYGHVEYIPEFYYDTILINATYYHNKYVGRKTANGETFTNNGFTAAHRNIEFNTIVKVVNIRNNKFVYVRINDRCKSNVIDLTTRAAKQIGISSGKVKLIIKRIK
jgi:hypothetical protein